MTSAQPPGGPSQPLPRWRDCFNPQPFRAEQRVDSSTTSIVPATRSCVFSPDRLYRYVLTIRWSDAPVCTWVMLNPSTADERQNDPTVERCERRSRAWGYGSCVVTNIFAYRATDPKQMKAQADPVGPDNDRHIREQAQQASLVVCAWGSHGRHMGRSEQVRKLLAGIPLHALRVCKDGSPGHPLYIAYSQGPVPYGLP